MLWENMRSQNKKIKSFRTRGFEVQMYNNESLIAATFLLLLISLVVTISLYNNSNLTMPDPVFAQVKGGLSASSVNPNSTMEKELVILQEEPLLLQLQMV
jgi:hypothetical protein